MELKSLQNADVKGKTVLYRAPYDIDVVEEHGKLVVKDDMRISATLPTLQYLLEQDCKIVILTYVGRPDGKIVENLRTTPHAEKLAELLGHKVYKIDDCIGAGVEERISQMNSGEILMLENVRFYSDEMIDDDNFASKLCKGMDIIVFDGFPQAHREHASTTGIERHLPAVAGLYLEKEVNMLVALLQDPRRPFTVIIGGAKVSDKVGAIRNLIPIADTFLVGGAVANVFLKAQGKTLGDSFIEDVFVDKAKRAKVDWVDEARSILNEIEKAGKKIITPVDLIVTNGTEIKTVNMLESQVEKGWMALDIEGDTAKMFRQIISESKTVFLNGPMGKFEDERFSHGSQTILSTMKDLRGTGDTIIAGGDTIDLVRQYGDLNDYTNISLAGGATLEFLAGKELPALLPLLKDFKFIK